MTDFFASDDELLSSFIDGDLTGDERTRLETRLTTDPALQSRLDQLRAAAELVSTPVDAITSEQGDSLIAAALAASATTPAVTDLAAARSSRLPRWGVRVASAAAGVLLLAIAVPALVDRGDSDDDSFAGAGESQLADDETSADAAGDDAADDDGGSLDSMATAEMDGDDGTPESGDEGGDDGSDDDGGDDSSVAAVPAQEEMLSFTTRYGIEPFAGGFNGYATADELREAILDRFDAVAASIIEGSDDHTIETQGDSANLEAERNARLLTLGIDDCAAEIEDLEASLAPIVALDHATATVDGAPVAILLYALADGRVFAQVVDPTDCTIIESVELNPAG